MAKKEKEITWDDLETFESVGSRFGAVWVSITERGSLILSAGFAHKAKLRGEGGPTHAILSYSGSNKSIIVDFTSDSEAPGALKLTKAGNITITSTSFWKYFDLDPKPMVGRYPIKKVKIPKRGSVWVVTLSDKIDSTN